MSGVEQLDRRLSRRETRLLSSDPDELAEELAAEHYGLLHRPDERKWYDARSEDERTKMEVKSTHTSIGVEYPARGRFRFRRDQTRSLVASNRRANATYALVVIDMDDAAIYFRRLEPMAVAVRVRERGGWNRAGHAEFSHQRKIPYTVFFPGVEP